MKITFLGTGTSVGVPRIACDCAVCRSTDPKNERLRCSLLVEHAGCNILIDTTPDLRTQALKYRIDHLDAVLFTHGHADHLHGLDDVRIYCFHREAPLPCYADEWTIGRIERVFDYAFRTDNPSSVPQLTLHRIEGRISLYGLEIEPLTIYHGRLPVLAFRIGDFAYATDCSSIPEQSQERLRGLDTLVLDALRYRAHPTHFNVEQAVEMIERLAPRRAYLTHIAHDLDHRTACAELPERVELAYDGLILDFPGPA